MEKKFIMVSFINADQEAYFSSLSYKDIIASLTLDNVKHFLESLGVEHIEVHEDKKYLICPTICHNPIEEAKSMKLYWYQNNKIFRCYTECNEAMSIFELYKRYMTINYYNVSLEEAESYVKHYLNNICIQTNITKTNYFDTTKYHFDTAIPTLPAYNENILDCFIKYYHPSWIKDGIKKETMDQFDIRFSIGQNKIIIPHRDIDNRLIGVRSRTLEENEIELYGKYRPIQVGDIIYTHPLQFNLYGIYQHKKAIQKRRIAIIAEAEKSVMLDHGYYDDFATCVACCGSSFNKYQISLLTDILGANEIVIALDKEYNMWNDEKGKKYINKIEKMCYRYLHKTNFSYIIDYDNILQEKDSPFDKGKDIFEHLFKTRIRVR